MRLDRILGAGALLLAFTLSCATHKDPGSSPRLAISDGWLAMGTFFELEIRVRPDEAPRAHAWIEWARDEILRLEKIYSRHDPESEVSTLNRALARDGSLTREQVVGSELESILFSAIEIWEGSGGAFDMTIGPLVDVWTEAVAVGEWPSLAQLRRAKGRLGSHAFLLTGDGVLEVLSPRMRVDLDGISKGAVLDRLRSRFEADLPNAAALLNFGESSILAIGDPDGEGWRLRVRSRNPADTGHRVLLLRDQALSVSASIGSMNVIAGEPVSHVIDPRTGSVVEEGVEALVLADRAVIADGWSTALLVIGANRNALRLVEKAGLEVNVIDHFGRSVSSEHWERVVAQHGVER